MVRVGVIVRVGVYSLGFRVRVKVSVRLRVRMRVSVRLGVLMA